MNPTIHPDRPKRRPDGMTAAELVAYEMRYAVRDEATGCLLTTAHLNSTGYGHVRLGRKMVLLHRLVLEHHVVGRPLSRDEEGRHRCHRPPCIEPSHLCIGSHTENMADMVAASRGRSGQKVGEGNSNAKLNDDAIRDIRKRAASGMSHRAIARLLDVNKDTINNIVKRKAWAHVED